MMVITFLMSSPFDEIDAGRTNVVELHPSGGAKPYWLSTRTPRTENLAEREKKTILVSSARRVVVRV
jgi:hypothetical protein